MSGNDRNENPFEGGGVVMCGELVFTTQLSSPQAEVLNDLKVGDELTIETRSNSAQAYDSQNRLAGGIIATKALDLVNCILQGYDYKARVIGLDGARCTIQVMPL